MPKRERRGDLRDAEILEDAQGLDEVDVLVDEAHAELTELAGRERERHRLAVDVQFASIRVVEPREHLDQGRFARTVFAEEAVNLPGEHVEVDAAQRLGTAKALRQVAKGEARVLRGVGHYFFSFQRF